MKTHVQIVVHRVVALRHIFSPMRLLIEVDFAIPVDVLGSSKCRCVIDSKENAVFR